MAGLVQKLYLLASKQNACLDAS